MSNLCAQASFDFAALRRATMLAPRNPRQPALQRAVSPKAQRASTEAERKLPGLTGDPQDLAPAALR